jgi:DNA-binding NarL/FixJ family response regulator
MECIEVIVLSQRPQFYRDMEHLLSSEKDILAWGMDKVTDEALPILDDSPPHVVLIDVDGYLDSDMSTVRRIKKRIPNTGVIVLTSSLDNALILKALKSQVAACIDRNTKKDELVQIVRNVANGKYPINDILTSQSQVAEDILEEFEETFKQRGVVEIFAPLTTREITILEYVAKGYSNEEITDRLGIPDQTFKNHITSILRKLNINFRTEAVMTAITENAIAINRYL